MILYSVIICTYNRVSYLKETVSSLEPVLKERADVELLIIDNNSNDGTSELKELHNATPRIRYILEKEQGLSHARNRGIKEAKGDVLVFLDDDIDIDSVYFNVLDELLKDNHISIVGGKVLPYKVSIPDWLPYKYYYLVSIFDLGNYVQNVTKLMGANYAMRKEAAATIGWYDPELGRKGDLLLGGEEIDYLNRAANLGYTIIYSPDLIVYHKINNKLNKKYILDYSVLIGKSEVIIDNRKSKWKVGAKIVKSVIDILAYSLVGFYFPNPKIQMSFKIRYVYAKGYLNAIRTLI